MRTSFLFCARWIGLGALAVVLSLPLPACADAPAAAQPSAQPPTQAPAQPAVPAKPADEAARLVQLALQGEADGKPVDRATYLQQALAVAPDFALAHWQSGEIRAEDKWVSIDDAARQTARSAKLDQYRKLRDQAGNTVDEQLNLARWCEKAGLKEQQRAHLMFALELQPNCKEAISKLGLVRYRGQLVPAAQLDDIKAKLKQGMTESKEWKDRVDDWAQRLKDHPNDPVVLKQIRAVRDPMAVFSLERGLGHSGQDACLAVVDALAAIPQQTATNALVHIALNSPIDEVSRSAVYALKSRSQYAYVPFLLSLLKMPVRYEYDVLNFSRDNFTQQLLLFQEGPDENHFASVYDSQTQLPNPHGPAVQAMQTREVAASQKPIAAVIVNQIEQRNKRSEQFNSVLASILETTTDQQLGTDPVDWWNWWYDQNEYYTPPSKPDEVVSFATTSYQRSDCFVAGTPIWTISGPMQIEKINVGELVLAQDPGNGEMAYKPVLAAVTRPASPVIEVRIGEHLIRCARGHPFWVSGKDWQMAKELKAGEWLHTAHGPVQIDSAEPSDEAVCYNFVVADFHDYFVGDAKVLVHDNLLRGPTLATVPGLAEAK